MHLHLVPFRGSRDTFNNQHSNFSLVSYPRDSLNGDYFVNLFSVVKQLLIKEEVLQDEQI